MQGICISQNLLLRTHTGYSALHVSVIKVNLKHAHLIFFFIEDYISDRMGCVRRTLIIVSFSRCGLHIYMWSWYLKISPNCSAWVHGPPCALYITAQSTSWQILGQPKSWSLKRKNSCLSMEPRSIYTPICMNVQCWKNTLKNVLVPLWTCGHLAWHCIMLPQESFLSDRLAEGRTNIPCEILKFLVDILMWKSAYLHTPL